ncbi:MAG: hypothetical protein CL483_02930 [Acidobacteria bacterium]|nr:hypothetical protein [Acidobacteriota bacterium]
MTTTAHSCRRRLTAGLLTVGLFAWGVAGTSDVVLAQSRSFFISFADADGVPVTDLTREDVVVELDGELAETLSLEPIDWPVRVTVFVDNGINTRPMLDDIREGLEGFVAALVPDVEVAIATTGGRPQFWAEHTINRVELADAIGVLSPAIDGHSTYLDALYEEAERMHEDEVGEYFPVVVMISTNGPEGSTRVRDRPFREMMERLLANSATVHTMMFAHPSFSGAPQMRWGIDIAEATGGGYRGLSSPNGFRVLLPQLAEDIARKHRLMSNQFRLTYMPPEGSSDRPAVRVLTTRTSINMVPTRDGKVP